MLIGAAVFSTTASAAEMPFSDVGKKKWFYDEVLYVYEKGLMTGTSETKFEPNASLTRAMFITILGRLAGAEETESNKFSDIKKKNWYSGYVGWAVDSGIVTGYEDGTFKPNKALTREEMAACISRYVDFMGIRMPRESTAPVEFADKGKIAKWAREYVEVLRRAGIANGDTAEKYNPKANITRAEMATVIMNLIAAEAKAWQGYEPDPAADGYAVYSAAYLYYNGTAVTGDLGSKLVEKDGSYPILSTYYDAANARRNATPGGSTGICTTVMEELVLKDTPVIKIAYSFEGEEEPETLGGFYTVNPSHNDWSRTYCHYYCDESFTFVKGEKDGEFSTATFDMTAFVEKHTGVDDRFDMSHIVALPFAEDYTGDAKFNISYIAFFKDQATADSFKAEDLDDYFANYSLYSSISVTDLTEDVKKEYDALLAERIDDILTSESEITPEQIEAEGGTCYYLSSINGDDNNDGLSPETPWKSLDKLWNIKKPNVLEFFIPKEGDGIFFERGSVWYPEKHLNSSKLCLDIGDGVSLGAYGEGEKPRFTVALDFTDSNGVGNWKPTEWDNVWCMDEIDERHEYEISDKCDIGYMIFNDGEAFGIRICESTASSDNRFVDFGEGKTTKLYGLNSPNGKDYFYVGTDRKWENPGTALRNNYEFIYDAIEGEIYLYWDEGNPADSFDEIMISRNGYAIRGGNNIRIDNLAITNSATWGAMLGEHDISISNCEIAYCGGSMSSIESGIEFNGRTKNVYMKNNYCHDIGDGPLSMQSQEEKPGDPTYIENVELCDNVIVACGNGLELAASTGTGLIDENGVAQNKLRNFNVSNNIMAYIGYGLCEWQGDATIENENTSGGRKLGEFLCTGHEFENCYFTDNIMMYGAGQMGITYFSSDTQQRGWILDDNTYLLNPEHMVMFSRRNNFNRTWQSNLANYGIYVTVPLQERYISYMASLGIGNSDKYYFYHGTTAEQAQRCFFMTGNVARDLLK